MTLDKVPSLRRLFLRRKFRLPIGIDAGTFTTKAVVVRKTQPLELEHVSVHSASTAPELIRHVIEQAGYGGRDAAFALPDGSTEVAEFQLPRLNDEELKNAIEWEAKKTVASQEFVFHDVLGFAGPDAIAVQIVIAARDIVQGKYERGKGLGVSPRYLETESSALLSTFAALYPDRLPDKIALIDLGFSSFRIVFLNGGRVSFTRALYFGLESLFHQCSQQSNPSLGTPAYSDLDALFRSLETSDSSKAPTKEGPRAAFERLLQENLYTLCDEYQRSEFFAKEHKQLELPQEIFLSGGGACVPFTVDYLAKHLSDRKVSVLNPFKAAASVPEGTRLDLGPLWSIAVGLAIRGAE